MSDCRKMNVTCILVGSSGHPDQERGEERSFKQHAKPRKPYDTTAGANPTQFEPDQRSQRPTHAYYMLSTTEVQGIPERNEGGVPD